MHIKDNKMHKGITLFIFRQANCFKKSFKYSKGYFKDKISMMVWLINVQRSSFIAVLYVGA